MLYSKTCEYAIRALSYLALQPPGELRLLGDIAEAEDMPPSFASKILGDLVKAGVLRSARGPYGGYGLAVDPAVLTLLRIREIFDGTDDLDRCAAGLARCSDTAPCPLHDEFKPIRDSIRRYLRQTTLADMAGAVERKRALLRRGEA